jgi:APA family basic amino acid/polyamine antiporter
VNRWSTVGRRLVTAVVYILATDVIFGVLGTANAAASGAPFTDAAREMWGGWGADVIGIAAIISTFGCLNGWILLQGQIPMAAARDRLFPKPFARTTHAGAPWVGLVVSSVFLTGLMFMNYTKSLVDQFTFMILLATLTTLIPYAFSAAAELMLMVTDRAAFAVRTVTKDVVVAMLGFGYAVWTIAGSGYEVVFKGFMLLMGAVPVYIWMKWRASKEPVALQAVPTDTLAPTATADVARVAS